MHQRVRQRSSTISNDKDGSVESGKQQARRTRKKRRKRRRQQKTHRILCAAFLFVCAGALVVAGVLDLWPGQWSGGVSQYAHVEQYMALYSQVRRSKGILASADSMEIRDNQDNEEMYYFSNLLGSTYGDNITRCSVSVMFLDPRLGVTDENSPHYYGRNASGWFTLESVAAMLQEDACVILLTTQGCDKAGTMDADDDERLASSIFHRSLPLFRNWIRQGRVRLQARFDWQKYQLQSCQNFGNPSAAFMNYDFWQDEFLPDVDSETVLLIQDDAVFCRPLVSSLLSWYQQFALVGAVWPPVATKLTPDPPMGMCRAMPSFWKSWLRPMRRWEMQQTDTLDFLLPHTDFPDDFCSHGQAPVGNGGFSLRNRTWMQTVIATCPHVHFSGLDSEHKPCKVLDQVNEDVYFGVVLRGLRAPLPDVTEASLFAVEMMWAEDAIPTYNEGESPSPLRRAKNDRAAPQVRYQQRRLSVPVGFHKPYWYQPPDLLLSTDLQRECPYLPLIFDPEMSRWEEIEPQATWTGIGK